MPRYTRGFRDDIDALQHFEDHAALLGAQTLKEYVDMADEFLGSPLSQLAGVEECQRPGGDWVRYNVATLQFGVMSLDRTTIYTYYIAEPRRLRGRTFREYCEDQCRRRLERA